MAPAEVEQPNSGVQATAVTLRFTAAPDAER
jgi:hypothetical protein